MNNSPKSPARKVLRFVLTPLVFMFRGFDKFFEELHDIDKEIEKERANRIIDYKT